MDDGGGVDGGSNGIGGDGGSAADVPAPKRTRCCASPITAEELEEEFAHHDPAVARVNNGSFGSCPATILAAQSRWQRLFLRQPDDFYFNTLRPSILRSRTLLRSLINAEDVSEVSLVDNATTAAAIVLQRASRAFAEGIFSPGDAVVMLHYAYGAVKKSIQAYVVRAGGHVIEVPLPFPVASDVEIVREFKRSLAMARSEGRRVRLAVIDHVTSMPSVVIPVKELVGICRDEGVDQVFVDAAHAIGNVAVDVRDIGADFYTSNLHKWFFCPPSVAFLYCRRSSAADVHHPVVSHEYGNGLAVESAWIGTRDYSSQLVVPEVMGFLDRFEGGIEGVSKRNHTKVVEMGEMLAKSWGTQLGSPPAMCSSMVMVGLPGCLHVKTEEDALRLRKHLRDEFRVEVPIYFKAPKDGEAVADGLVTGWARISHQVYNKAADYHRLRDAINKLVSDEEFNCAKLPLD